MHLHDKDALVLVSAELLREFLIATGVEWDEAYYRYAGYVEEGCFRTRSEWCCRKGSALKLYPVARELASQYIQRLSEQVRMLCDSIEAEGHSRPVVVVLRVDAKGQYKAKFDRVNPTALQIDPFKIGHANSLFASGEVVAD
jgi:hypothetical protein